MSEQTCDVVVIGAGPAGMRAAVTAANEGLSVTLIDEQTEAGGQIYRAVARVARTRPADLTLLGPEYAAGGDIVLELDAADITVLHGHTVWQISQDGTVWCSDGTKAKSITARFVIMASGAQERPVPVPGWTLPGVMTAGAAQILLKSDAMVPDGPVALYGSGPLLLLVADQLLSAGADIRVVAETTTFKDYLNAAPHLLGALPASKYLKKGIALRRHLKAAGVPIIKAPNGVSIEGTERATGLRIIGKHGQTFEAETILLQQGVVPNTQASWQLRLDHAWHAAQHYWYPTTDRFGATSLANVFIAGDGAGIFGAEAAAAAGALAGLGVAHAAGNISAAARDQKALPFIALHKKAAAIRPLLDHLFPPPAHILVPDDATIICRCEEITAGQVRDAAKLGAPGPNQLKAFLRAGMGPCQGRMCGLSVVEIMARAHGKSPAEIGAYRIRPPLKPLSLAELAAMDDDTPTP